MIVKVHSLADRGTENVQPQRDLQELMYANNTGSRTACLWPKKRPLSASCL